MRPKWLISFDLAAATGSARLRLGRDLPRHSKPELERYLVNSFLPILAAHEGFTVSGIRSNESDPPDVLFEKDTATHGIELSEVLPVNRLEKNAILNETRRSIVQALTVGETTRNQAVTITLKSNYAPRIQLRGYESTLAAVLERHFTESRHTTSVRLRLPAELEESVHSIFVAPQDLAGDPRIARENEPLLVFSAQHTLVAPDEDFPTIIDNLLGRKCLHRLATPSWLVLWSSHYAFASLKQDIIQRIDAFVQTHEFTYERLFYFHMFPGDGLTEIIRDDRGC